MYEIGDKVRIIDDFWKFRYNSDDPGGEDPDVDPAMEEYACRIYEIEEIADKYTTCRYRLKKAHWWWDERWLEPASQVTINIDEDSIIGVFQNV